MTESDLIHEVLVTPRDAHVPFPGVQCIRRPNWHQLIAPAFRQSGLNSVSLAILDESDADRVIDDTIRRYEELGVGFRWTVGPDSRPADLGERLLKRGLEPVAVAGLAATYESVPTNPEIDVAVVGPESVSEFNEVASEGWNMHSTELCDYNTHVVRECPAKSPCFIARIGGKGVGVASYFAFPNSAYLMGGVVLPEFRHRGVYRALVQARREHARSAGLEVATSHAMVDTSAPILEGLGFRTVCLFTSYSSG